MRQGWVVMMVFIWVLGTLLGGLIEYGTIDDASQSKLAILTGIGVVRSEESWGFTEIVTTPLDYARTLWEAGTWQFAFLDNTAGTYIRWIVQAPLVAGFIWGLVITFISIFSKVLS